MDNGGGVILIGLFIPVVISLAVPYVWEAIEVLFESVREWLSRL